MEFVVVPSVAFAAAVLSLISGFGLGTLLLPTFALFFPLEIAIASTAVVHLANNAFKLVLFGKHVDRDLVLRFGIPAGLAALLGAMVLAAIGGHEPLFTWSLGETIHEVSTVSLVIALVMLGSAVIELRGMPRESALSQRWLPIGGSISGFFGGLSGHQGALRSAFLLRFKERLTPQSFVGTNVAIACLVDVARIAIYGSHFDRAVVADHGELLLLACLAAFAGVALGARLIRKMTIEGVGHLVAIVLIAIALAIGSGLLSRR